MKMWMAVMMIMGMIFGDDNISDPLSDFGYEVYGRTFTFGVGHDDFIGLEKTFTSRVGPDDFYLSLW